MRTTVEQRKDASVRVRVYYDGVDGCEYTTFPLSTDEAEGLAAELTKAAAEARANERRCGTCGSYGTDLGVCRWGYRHTDSPGWVRVGQVIGVHAGSQCAGWTKREGGQGNG